MARWLIIDFFINSDRRFFMSDIEYIALFLQILVTAYTAWVIVHLAIFPTLLSWAWWFIHGLMVATFTACMIALAGYCAYLYYNSWLQEKRAYWVQQKAIRRPRKSREELYLELMEWKGEVVDLDDFFGAEDSGTYSVE
jgi:hypothetical protein